MVKLFVFARALISFLEPVAFFEKKTSCGSLPSLKKKKKGRVKKKPRIREEK